MRREVLALACLLLSGRLSAWGGSTMTWLDGTQPWDTTPMNELDLQALGSGGDGHGLGGLGGQWGIVDELQATGTYELPVDRGDPAAELDLRLREPYFPDWRPAFSLYARAPYVDRAWTGWAGLAADWEPFESDVAMNAEMGDGGRWRLRLGLWTPYLISALRLGAEASWLEGSAEAYTPQVAVNAPGDISFQAGLRVDAQDKTELWMLRLSYEIFQNP
jgi:hypothetical protein